MAEELPRVRDVDPLRLLGDHPPGLKLQPYVPRDVDDQLVKAFAAPGLVMVVHETWSGARRSVYEALLRTQPDRHLALDVVADDAPPDTLLWLDLAVTTASARQAAHRLRQWLAPGRDAVLFVDKLDEQGAQLTDMLAELKLNPKVVEISGQLSDRERSATRRVNALFAGDTLDELVSAITVEPEVRHVAGYHADTDSGEDHLGITTDVHMLADLVASRLVRPPLSIGLFGNWGTGKSFFMRHLRERVRELATAAAQEETLTKSHGPAVSSYCSSVRQITFNAWHYVEANLWASLATHIFDSLATGDSEEVLRRRADELAELRQTEQSLLTQLSAVRLERRLVAAQQERRPLALTGEDYAWVAQELGVPTATAADVQQFATELGGLGAETRRIWTLLRRNRFALVMIVVAIVLAIGLAFFVRSPVWPVLAGVLSLLVGVTPVVSRVREAAARIRQAAETADRRLTELDEEAARLERAVAELATGCDATAFAKSRHTSEDYRQHLGIVSMLRRDLETFAAILDEERHVDGGLERIVLYVDDLDRCPPDVVVKVLEAVHLLVALPVFVVVVAVDPRWLDAAIRHHYATMLPDGSVTPMHYLEKIFQIPFRLSPMDEDSFGNLVQALSGAEDAEPDDVPDRPALTQPGRSDMFVHQRDTELWSEPAPSLEVRPRQLHITPEELEFVTQLAPLVPTPRAAKRLINLYRLVRARLSNAELDEFVRSGDFRAVLVLLAGEPEQAPIDLPAEDYERWLPLVRRFSFR